MSAHTEKLDARVRQELDAGLTSVREIAEAIYNEGRTRTSARSAVYGSLRRLEDVGAVSRSRPPGADKQEPDIWRLVDDNAPEAIADADTAELGGR